VTVNRGEFVVSCVVEAGSGAVVLRGLKTGHCFEVYFCGWRTSNRDVTGLTGMSKRRNGNKQRRNTGILHYVQDDDLKKG
jgi:hypothetical protein